jgi:hypothetical protein
MATNKQLDEFIKVVNGTSSTMPSWFKNGETYNALDPKDPQQFRNAKLNYIIYAIDPSDSIISPSSGDIQLRITAIKGDGTTVDSDVNPELFSWYSMDESLVSISDTGLVSYVGGGNDDPNDPIYAYAGGICRSLNPDQLLSDSVLARFDVRSV